ncbi:type II secretion system protein GspD [Wenzhouxiangella sp. XN79A]|uniref:secretin N-terminal domain-containing protein n=1 Tax=Wenzhouxiangella sp. XN79A TaxID=2724193 RepID=UPI00144AD422|nr:secretin N-terminal domain-containing protein [Wenzhouxiangella sp. XN79A]NKI34395.1 type II secretion system protein GspD [Wenzhouxiangella sp. XN79A]
MIHRCLTLLLLAGLAVPGALSAQEAGDDGHVLNFQDAEIRSLITTVADITGRNIVIDPAVSGRVTIVSNESLDADEVYEVFLSVLAVHGFSALSDGNVTRIVPDATARFGANGDAGAGAQDQVTRLIALSHVQASEAVALLRSLVPQSAYLAAHPGSNSVLISDRAAGVRRIESVLRRMDSAVGDGPEVLALNHASASELAETVNAIYSGDQPLAYADPRTNSLILGGSPGQRLRLRTLVSHLDTPLDAAGGSRVVYLRYADADSLVPVLESLVEQPGEDAPRARIQAHTETNAIVITAPPSIYREIASVIEQLDIRRAQVLVEAIIAEVAADTGRELGIQWQFFESGDEGFFGGTNFQSGGRNILNLSAGLTGGEGSTTVLPGAGLNLGYVGGRTSLLGIELLEIGALARALATDSNTNVLSTPSIVTMDNHPASINVGQEVPFLSGSFLAEGISNADGQVNPFQTIERREVGVKLNVTPHINEGGSIMLAIDQEVSSLAPVIGAVDLVTNKRTISTRVMVPDGAMLVLGGLISDDLQEGTERVPGLGRIPLLGELFTYRADNRVKRNLMVFIRPRVLDDPELMDAVTAAQYSGVRERQLQQRADDTGVLRRPDTPLLPELDAFLQAPSGDGGE